MFGIPGAKMKITNIDTLIEEFRNGRDVWSRTTVELAVREIERLRKRIAELEEALTKIARCQSLRFRLSPYEYGLLEQIIGIAEHALRDGE
jgi:hypothetical protein